MSHKEENRAPKHLRLQIAVIVAALILIAFALSWLTMPRTPRNPRPQAPHSSSTSK
ncbi:MAG: hypothetical protein ACRD2G_06735 [Terriglobia bacterium]